MTPIRLSGSSLGQKGTFMPALAHKTLTATGVAMLASASVAGVAVNHRSSVPMDIVLTTASTPSDTPNLNFLGGDKVALTVGPMGTVIPNAGMNDAAQQIYLDSLGFSHTGTVIGVETPVFYNANVYDYNATIDQGENQVVAEVQAQINAGNFGVVGQNDEGGPTLISTAGAEINAEHPLVIFGYSQGADIAGASESQIAALLESYGIKDPEPYVKFVLIGDSESAEGGFLTHFVSTMPSFLQPLATDVLNYLNLSQLIDPADHLETPTSYFQTDVFTLHDDGWSDWPSGQVTAWSGPDWATALEDIVGMFTVHLAYLGLESLGDISGPNPLADTKLDTGASTGMTDYYNFAKLSPEQLAVDIFHAGQNIGDFPTSWGEIGTWFDDLVGLPTTEAGWMADIDSFVGTL